MIDSLTMKYLGLYFYFYFESTNPVLHMIRCLHHMQTSSIAINLAT